MRPVIFLVAALGLIPNAQIRAQAPAPPFTPAKQYSADLVDTWKDGAVGSVKMYIANGKLRSESNANGSAISIIRPDEKKLYWITPGQKRVMETTYDPTTSPLYIGLTSGADSKFDFVGTETTDGLPCFKYKMTVTANNKVFYWWTDAATMTPVKMTPQDGSVVVRFSNYVAGAQNASLFEPPAGYQVMPLGGAGGGGAPKSKAPDRR